MILHNIIQTIFLFAGIIALYSAIFDCNWFFTARNAEFIVKHFGRGKSRIIYGFIGILFIVAAVFFY